MVTCLVALLSAAVACGAAPRPQVAVGGPLLPLALSAGHGPVLLLPHLGVPGARSRPLLAGHFLRALGDSPFRQSAREHPATPSRRASVATEQEVQSRARTSPLQQSAGPGLVGKDVSQGQEQSSGARGFARQQVTSGPQRTPGVLDDTPTPAGTMLIRDQELGNGTRNFVPQSIFDSLMDDSLTESNVLSVEELDSQGRNFLRQQVSSDPQLIPRTFGNTAGSRAFTDQDGGSGARLFFPQNNIDPFTDGLLSRSNALQGQEIEDSRQISNEPTMFMSMPDRNFGSRVITEQDAGFGARNLLQQNNLDYLTNGGNGVPQVQELDSTRNTLPQQTTGEPQQVPRYFGNNVGSQVNSDQEAEGGDRGSFRQQTDVQPQLGLGTPNRGFDPALGSGQEAGARARTSFSQQTSSRPRVVYDAPPGQLSGGARGFPGLDIFGARGPEQPAFFSDNTLDAEDGSRDRYNPSPESLGGLPEDIAIEAFDDTRFRSSRPMGGARLQGGDGFLGRTRSSLQLPDDRLQQFPAEVVGDFRFPEGVASALADVMSGQQQYSVSFEGAGYGYGYSVRADGGSSRQASSAGAASTETP
ncbi:uncharacterized protein LOC134536365 [Bacillus rossius redtenbacheri]|uniref:uncharacterized protein LOC134536365 n=1 Tax=Bacillus rossius redtenbacheri TaxID=93214 RepID=UPI002FDCC98E